MLATALVKIMTPFGEERTARALIDQGSQICFITLTLVQQLRLKSEPTSAEIHEVGKSSINYSTSKAYFSIKPLHGNTQIDISGLVLKKLTKILPSYAIPQHNWKQINELELADPFYFEPGPIDLLIGADIYGDIMMGNFIKGASGTPTAQETIFGWVLSGRTYIIPKSISVHNFHVLTELNNQLRKFWELEEMLEQKRYTEEEEACEKAFEKRTSASQVAAMK